MIHFLLMAAAAAGSPQVSDPLQPLEFLVGHCWEGTFPSGERDVHCFEPVYGGKHVRDSHEVTGDGPAYRGETLYSADRKLGRVSYTYWNSLGGVSRGTMQAAAGRLDFGDERYRGPDGKEASISTHWRRVGDDAYEAVSLSADVPSMSRTVRYRRVGPAVSIDQVTAPDGSLTLVHEAIVDAPSDALWSAISTADGWRGWAVPIAWSSADDPDLLETSYDPNAVRGDKSTIRHRVLARVPGRMIAFRTLKAPEGFPHFDLFTRTTSVFELAPVSAGRTRVRIVGAGYPDGEAGRELIGFFREGNRITLERLQRRFTDGPIDWAKEASGRAQATK